MSLDIQLSINGVKSGNRIQLFEANITHNLNKMADKAFLYHAIWKPYEYANEGHSCYARNLIDPLKHGIYLLRHDPEYFKQFNPENGWGDYYNLLDFAEKLLEACEDYPFAEVHSYG